MASDAGSGTGDARLPAHITVTVYENRVVQTASGSESKFLGCQIVIVSARSFFLQRNCEGVRLLPRCWCQGRTRASTLEMKEMFANLPRV